jgi:hypothetical protein
MVDKFHALVVLHSMKVSQYPMDRRGLDTGKEKKNALSVAGIKPGYLGHHALSPVAKNTGLFWLPVLSNRRILEFIEFNLKTCAKSQHLILLKRRVFKY